MIGLCGDTCRCLRGCRISCSRLTDKMSRDGGRNGHAAFNSSDDRHYSVARPCRLCCSPLGRLASSINGRESMDPSGQVEVRIRVHLPSLAAIDFSSVLQSVPGCSTKRCCQDNVDEGIRIQCSIMDAGSCLICVSLVAHPRACRLERTGGPGDERTSIEARVKSDSCVYSQPSRTHKTAIGRHIAPQAFVVGAGDTALVVLDMCRSVPRPCRAAAGAGRSRDALRVGLLPAGICWRWSSSMLPQHAVAVQLGSCLFIRRGWALNAGIRDCVRAHILVYLIVRWPLSGQSLIPGTLNIGELSRLGARQSS